MSKDTKFCFNCGHELPANSNFCDKCGAQQGSNTSTSSESPSHMAHHQKPNMLNSGIYFIKHLFSINSVTSRANYWFGYLDAAIIGIILWLLISLNNLRYPLFINSAVANWPRLIAMIIISFIMTIIAIGNFTSLIRRLHDTNRSGHWLWLLLIPLVGPIVIIVFAAQKSDPLGIRFNKSANQKNWHLRPLPWIIVAAVTFLVVVSQDFTAKAWITYAFNQELKQDSGDSQSTNSTSGDDYTSSDDSDEADYGSDTSETETDDDIDSENLMHWEDNTVIAPNGTVQVLKEATGDTTDGKSGVIFMYKVTNTSDQSLSPNQIMQEQQITPYQNVNGVERLGESITPDEFQSISDYSDSSMAITDAIYSDDDNWDKSKIEPSQSAIMSDGEVYKLENSTDSITLKIQDTIQDEDDSIIDTTNNTYDIPTADSPIETLDITSWNG